MKNKIGFVILHYKADQDTAILLAQITAYNYQNLQVFVVDNGSYNIEYLKKKYEKNSQIYFIQSEKNVGFSKANNLGIAAARQANCDLIIVSNNDIEGKFDPLFYKKIIDFYEKNPQVAVIAPSIINLKNRYQNPYINQRPNYSVQKLNFIYNTWLGKFIYYSKWIYNLLLNLEFDKSHEKKQMQSATIYAPHGSFFVLTPTYFNYYTGLDGEVFLFNEENILAERVLNKHLAVGYFPEIEVLHKEDAATNLLFQQKYKKSFFVRKESYKSFRYFLNNYLKK